MSIATAMTSYDPRPESRPAARIKSVVGMPVTYHVAGFSKQNGFGPIPTAGVIVGVSSGSEYSLPLATVLLFKADGTTELIQNVACSDKPTDQMATPVYPAPDRR